MKPYPLMLLRVWLTLGFQSFGGGFATLTLIRRAVVEQYGWMTDLEFSRSWALCQVAPGINLLAIAILVGRKLSGTLGIFICLFGLLFPSVGITILITAFYVRFENLELVRAAVRGIVPAAVGMGLLTTWNMAGPLVGAGRSEGRTSYALGIGLLIAAGVIMAIVKPSVIFILVGAGILSALFQERRKFAADAKEKPEP